MTSYLVTWEIELDMETPEAAAQLAREIQLDPASLATHFAVSIKGDDEFVMLDTASIEKEHDNG